MNEKRGGRSFVRTEALGHAAGWALLLLASMGVSACSSGGESEAPRDSAAPFVTAANPANRQTNVAVSSAVEVTFSEPLDPATLTGSTVRLRSGKTFYAGEVSYSGTTAVFKPNGALESGALHTVHLTTDVTDTAGNHLAADYFWTFTTVPAPDITPPTVVSTSPIDGAVGARLNNEGIVIVKARFSEPLNPNSVSTDTFLLTQGSTPISGSVSYDPSTLTATFTSDAALSINTSYSARITTEVTDLANNHLATDKTWTFKTQTEPDRDPPSVVSTNPVADAIALPLNNVVTARFNEPIDPDTLTLNFSVTPADNNATPVSGAVSYDPSTLTAAFSPTVSLPIGKRYTARLVGGVGGVTDCGGVAACDEGGNPLAADYVWTFTAPAPRFAYVANSGSNSLSRFSINTTTGDLTLDPTGGVALGGSPKAVVVDPTMRFAYVSQESSGTGRVDSFSIDGSTGDLTLSGTVETGPLPSAIAVDPRTRFFYVVNSTTVTPYRIDPTTGVLTSTRTPETSMTGATSTAVHPNGRFVYVAGRTSTSPSFVIKRFLIDQNTGVLTSEEPEQSVSTNSGLEPQIVVDPSGKLLYASYRNGVGTLTFEIDIDNDTGNLTKVQDLRTGGGRPGMAVDPTGQFAYVSASQATPGAPLQGGVSMFRIDLVAGTLTVLGEVTAGFNPEAVTVDPSARFVYVVNRDSDDITIFEITRTGPQAGALTRIGTAPNPAPEGVSRPVSIAIQGGIVP